MKVFYCCLFLVSLGVSFTGCQHRTSAPSVGAVYQPAVDFRSWTRVNAQPRRSAPHGRLVTIYVNDLARQVKEQGGQYAPGAIIVKEAVIDQAGTPGQVDRIFTMEKRATGSLPRSNDWYFVVTDPAGKILSEGDETELNGRRCAVCHAGS